MKSYDDLKKQLLRDPEILEDYDSLEPEYELIRQIIKARTQKGLTQTQLANLIGTQQSAISRLESGSYNPTLSMLKKISRALDTKLSLTIG